jgi:DNA-3-methyladenine glycosylase I
VRCAWARGAELIAYHDREWGVPVHDDRTFFELLTLEGAQAGLSWETVLRKRAGYRAAFAAFDPARVAAFDDATVARLVTDPAIVRHRGKIVSTVANARAFLAVQAAFGSFDAYVWTFAGGAPLRAPRREPADVPATSAEGDALSRDLRTRGFRFVGPTIVYAFMQATGLVDDHLMRCFRSAPVR